MSRIDSHSVRALLASRALLVKIKRDLENQVRGLFKNLDRGEPRSHRAIDAPLRDQGHHGATATGAHHRQLS